jgi:hypothetical protein
VADNSGRGAMIVFGHARSGCLRKTMMANDSGPDI